MKLKIIAAVYACLLLPASAQILDITMTGTITYASGTDLTVQAGGTFTYNYLMNVADFQVVDNEPGFTRYASTSPLDIATQTFGDYVFSTPANQVLIYSNYALNGPNHPTTYGYEFDGDDTLTLGAPVAATANLGGVLLSTTSAVAPTTSLSSIQQIPVADFDAYTFLNFSGAVGIDQLTVDATVTSFTVTNLAPEPSTYALMLFGMLAMIGFSRFRRSTVGD